MPFSNLNSSWSNLARYYNNGAGFTQTSKPSEPSLKYTSFDDGLIRGGVLNAALASVNDTVRVGKFYLSGKGALFIIKQVGLQLANIPLEQDPTQKTLFGIEPTRLYNLGINNLLQVPINAFGGHLIRHGLTPIGGVGFLEGDSLSVQGYSYERAVLANNKLAPNTTVTDKSTNRLVSYLNKIKFENIGNIQLDEYKGGANSVYGIGKTRITTTNIHTNRSYRTSLNYKGIYEYIDQYRDDTINGAARITADIRGNVAANKIGLASSQSQLSREKNNLANLDPSSETYVDDQEYQKGIVDDLNSEVSYLLARQQLLEKELKDKEAEAAASNYDFQTRLNNVSFDPLYRFKNIQSQFGVSTGKVGPNNKKISSKVDSINVIDIVDGTTHYSRINSKKRSSDVLTNVSSDAVDGYYGKDIIKFAIEFLNNDSKGLETDLLAFRAYIDDFNDGMNARWSSYRYMGRGEDFYVYDGFTRDISVSFTIYAHSEEEILPIYRKLNYLLSTFAPDYNTDNKMRGNIAYLTVGDYLSRQPGIFTDIKLSGMLDTHWEIDLNNNTFQVPKHIKVSLSFKPIHTTLPRKVTKNNPFKSNFVLVPPVQPTKQPDPKTPAAQQQITTENKKTTDVDNMTVSKSGSSITNTVQDPSKLNVNTGQASKKGKGK